MQQTIRALRRQGQPTEVDCPYLTSAPKPGWKPPKGLRVFRRAAEGRTPRAVDVRTAIRAGQVPVLGISLPEGFYDPQSPWVIPGQGLIRGLHAVAGVAVSVTGSEELVLIRNSWGRSWGDHGHAWLDDAFLSRHLKALLMLTHEVV